MSEQAWRPWPKNLPTEIACDHCGGRAVLQRTSEHGGKWWCTVNGCYQRVREKQAKGELTGCDSPTCTLCIALHPLPCMN